MVSEGNTLQIVASGNVVEWVNYFFLSGVPAVRAVSFTLTICRGHTGSSPRLGLDKSGLGTPVEQSFCSVLFCSARNCAVGYSGDTGPAQRLRGKLWIDSVGKRILVRAFEVPCSAASSQHSTAAGVVEL
ncbi:MAG: uncharacterized protein A8A55_2505 [Amphiamblys sp. WSBS2006]|nr:MAG: uncharacterized protein A8A55_2505 [Amphiamblys sp. WSBS2006]